jgi:predicted AlkP superfamily pyrophosphatase or phosphodiesterase
VILLDDHLERESYHVVDWSPVAMIQPGPGQQEEVYRRLSGVPHLAVFRKGELPPRLQFNRNPRIPAIIAIAAPGWSITDRTGLFRYASTGGAHGYDNAVPEMGALFLGLGPGLARGKVVDRVRAVDVYSLMSHLLGLSPAPHDGSLDSIRAVLRPPAGLLH